jgi:hypothetical protein
MADLTGVHAAHCCLVHGCKYGHQDCPVTEGKAEQMYPCEYCTANQVVEVDPTELLPGDVVVKLGDHDLAGCHCDVRVTVLRGSDD